MGTNRCGQPEHNGLPNAVARFLAAAHQYESVSVPIDATTRLIAWIALVGSPASLIWITYGPNSLRNSDYLTWPVVGAVTRFTFLYPYRAAAFASLITAFILGCALAIITEGFRHAGRRLLWITCVHDVVGTAAFLPAALALLAAVVTLALFVALIIAGAALMLLIVAGLLSSL